MGYIIVLVLGILVGWYAFKAVKYGFGNFGNLMDRLCYMIISFIRNIKKWK